jgi:hypothetical protein
MLNSNQALLLMAVCAAAGAMCARGVALPDLGRPHGPEASISGGAIAPRADSVALSLDDSEITAMVENGLANEFGMAVHSFHVDTQRSVVTLSGNVDTVMDHDLALQIVSDTVGVRRVVDAVTVRNAAAADLWSGSRSHPNFQNTI